MPAPPLRWTRDPDPESPDATPLERGGVDLPKLYENIVMFDQMQAALRDNRERGGMNDPLLKIIRSLRKKEGIDDKKVAQAEELAINLKRCASDLKIVSGLLKKKEQEGK